MDSDGAKLIAAQGQALILGIPVTFILGFVAGQLCFLLIAAVLIRLIIFEDPRTQSKETRRSVPLATRIARGGQTTLGGVNGNGAAGGSSGGDVDISRLMMDIMSKVNYEIEIHPGESIDWLNVILAQAVAGYRQDMQKGGWSMDDDALSSNGAGLKRSAREWMETMLNSQTVGKGMSFLDPIQVTHIDLGDSYPILSNARVRPADDLGRMRVEVDVDFSDCVSLAIETKLLVNVPRPRFAVLPISLGLTIERFSGTFAVEIFSTTASSVLPSSALPSSTSSTRSRHELHFSLHPDFTLDASATSLVGSRAKLQDLPKIEQLLIDRVRNYVHQRFVWPRYWSVSLPNLVPRRAHGGEEEKMDVRPGVDSRPRIDINGVPDLPHDGATSVADHDAGDEGSLRRMAQDGNEALYGPQADHSIPGTLPFSVEAWRTHAASVGAPHSGFSRELRRRHG